MKNFFILSRDDKPERKEVIDLISDYVIKNGGSCKYCLIDEVPYPVPKDTECIITIGGMTEDEKALYERKIGKIDEKDSYLAQIVLFESYEENRGEPLVLSYYQFENKNFCLKKCSEMIQKQKLVYGDKLLKVTCSSRMDFIVLDE